MQPKRWINVTEACALLAKIGYPRKKRAVAYWCAHGRIPATKRLGGGRGRGEWWIDLRELKALSDEGRDLYEELVQAINEQGR